MTEAAYEGQVIQGQVEQSHPAMAPPDPGGNNLPARREDFEGLETGLDDLSFDEIPTPRIRILHAYGKFVDNQTEVERESIRGIILGFQRQRIMWDSDMDEGGQAPKCKSNDAVNGLPNTDMTSDMAFPFEDSAFDQNTVPVSPEYNRVILPCDSCNFRDWTKSRGGKNIPPKCSDVFNLIVMFDAYDTGSLQPAFMPLKKSSLKPIKAHLARYRQQGVPAYTDFVEFTLRQEERGGNAYSVPVVKVFGQVDPQMYSDCSKNYAQLRDFATRIRTLEEGPQIGVQQRFEETQQTQPQAPPPQAPAPQAQPQQAPPQQAPQPAPAPAAPVQPQQSQPAAPRIPQQHQAPQATPAQQAPPAAPAPASPPPAPTPAPAPPPAPAPAATPAPPSVPTAAPAQAEAAPATPQPTQPAPAPQVPAWEGPAPQGTSDDDLPF